MTSTQSPTIAPLEGIAIRELSHRGRPPKRVNHNARHERRAGST
ncbi:MAG: hypothetical protein JWQ59_55, partial [Cryobacterium sp.]|nr:hypothetical protein [Cryobacterium sp.]